MTKYTTVGKYYISGIKMGEILPDLWLGERVAGLGWVVGWPGWAGRPQTTRPPVAVSSQFFSSGFSCGKAFFTIVIIYNGTKLSNERELCWVTSFFEKANHRLENIYFRNKIFSYKDKEYMNKITIFNNFKNKVKHRQTDRDEWYLVVTGVLLLQTGSLCYLLKLAV